MRIAAFASILMLATAALGCEKAPEEKPTKADVKPEKSPASSSSARLAVGKRTPADMRGLLSRMNKLPGQSPKKVAAKPVAAVEATPDDPVKGKFDLKDAGKGLKGEGYFMATVETSAGNLECELWHDKAPITVANFVGLARGLRPWKAADGKWVKKPLYDGTPFHRVIKGFMIQGGDPAGNGSGGPGYVIPDEVWEDAHHDQRGLLCMANRGPNTNGSQFFIMDGKASHLDGGYTIFGKCGPDETIEKIANTPVRGDRATEPVSIKSVKVRREAKLPEKPADPAAAPSGAPAPSGAGAPSAAPAAAPSAAPAP